MVTYAVRLTNVALRPVWFLDLNTLASLLLCFKPHHRHMTATQMPHAKICLVIRAVSNAAAIGHGKGTEPIAKILTSAQLKHINAICPLNVKITKTVTPVNVRPAMWAMASTATISTSAQSQTRFVAQ